MSEKQKYDILDESGALSLAKGILDKVNVRISQRIVQTLSADDEKHVPSAAAVLKAINSSKHVSIQTITGDINVEVPLEKRSTSVLYFQRDNEEDKTWSIYIWNADPTLDPDPDGYWICIGTTEIDLSKYWSKSDEDVAELSGRLGVDTLKTDVETLKASDTAVKADVAQLKTDVANINITLDDKVSHDEMSIITEAVVQAIIDYAESETDPFPAEAATVAELNSAIASAIAAGKDIIRVDLTSDIAITGEDLTIPAGIEATIKIPAGVTVSCGDKRISVAENGKLALTGSGTIAMASTNSKAAVYGKAGAEITINGVTIDATADNSADNFSYGVSAAEGGTINMISGTIKTVGGSCLTTNNTTGGATINVYDGELYSSNGYAIYNAAQSDINISGGTVQGINSRMGVITISGNAKIICTEFNESHYDKIGENIATTGCIWLGDTIALITGTYNGSDNAKTVLTIKDNATVESKFRAGIGVYMVDTKLATTATVDVLKAANVTTSDASSEAVKVYDHAYITQDATAAGKTYNPAATCDLTVTVGGSKIYPAA